MMNVYLLKGSHGEFEEYHEWIIRAYVINSEAAQEADRLNRLDAKIQTFQDEVNAHMEKWIDPVVYPDYRTLPDVPRWPASLTEKMISHEMREERQRIKTQRQVAGDFNDEIGMKQYEARRLERVHFILTSNKTHEEKIAVLQTDGSWRLKKKFAVEEVELVIGNGETL